MKLRHIYINKEGEPMGNPDPDSELLLIWESREEKIKQYHSGLLPFEDKDDVKLAVNDSAKDEAYLYFDGIHFKPNTLIPVDLEVEVVEQWRSEATKNGILAINGDGGLWHSMMENDNDPNKEYRKVLRIKN